MQNNHKQRHCDAALRIRRNSSDCGALPSKIELQRTDKCYEKVWLCCVQLVLTLSIGLYSVNLLPKVRNAFVYNATITQVSLSILLNAFFNYFLYLEKIKKVFQ